LKACSPNHRLGGTSCASPKLCSVSRTKSGARKTRPPRACS